MGKPVLINTEPVVKVGIPFYGGIPASMSQLMAELLVQGLPGYKVLVTTHQSALLTHARNHLIEEPEGIHFDYLFQIDSDMGFQGDVPQFDERGLVPMAAAMKRILDRRLDICGGLYVRHEAPHTPHIYRWARDAEGNRLGTFQAILDFPEDQVIEVDAVGTGFLCVKRQVFYAMGKELQRRIKVAQRFEEWRKEQTADLPKELTEYLDISQAQIHKPFWLDHFYDPIAHKWTMMGEDMFFCREAQKLGFKIHCDTGARIGHKTDWYVDPDFYERFWKAETIAARGKYNAKHGLAPTPEVING